MASKSTVKSAKRKSTPAGRSRSRTSAAKTAPAAAPTPAPEVKVEEERQAVAPVPLRAVDVPTDDAPATDEVAKTPSDQTGRAKRPDLLDAVASRSALKRPEVKLVMDLLLEEMGKLLDTHEEVAVPPLGKLMVKKRMEKPGGDMLTLKLKRVTAAPQPSPAATKDGTASDVD